MKVLTQVRRERGFSQTQLARLLEVHPSWVAHTEAGRWIPSPASPTARRLVRLLGRPLNELLAETDDANEPALQDRGGRRR